MKRYIRVLLILCNVILLNVANQCMAVEKVDNEYMKDNENYIEKVYYIEQNKEREFIENISNEITVNEKTYTYVKNEVEQEFKLDVRQIDTTKTIKLDTNDRETIINELGTVLDYNEDGYIGRYVLNEDSINIETQNNGYFDSLVEKTEEYDNLDKNDLDYIPKQIYYKGKKLDLLSTNWEVTDTTKIGNVDVPSTYKAICYYATTERIYRPNTYIITAEYTGDAKKEITMPSKIIVTYKEKQLEQPEEKENNILIPILSGTGTIIIFLGGLLLFRKGKRDEKE